MSAENFTHESENYLELLRSISAFEEQHFWFVESCKSYSDSGHASHRANLVSQVENVQQGFSALIEALYTTSLTDQTRADFQNEASFVYTESTIARRRRMLYAAPSMNLEEHVDVTTFIDSLEIEEDCPHEIVELITAEYGELLESDAQAFLEAVETKLVLQEKVTHRTKRRKQLIALGSSIVFAAFGAISASHMKPEKPA